MIKKTTLTSALSLAIAGMLYALSPSPAVAQTVSGDQIPTDNGDLTIHPLKHASMVLAWNGTTIYVDPAPAPGSPEGTDGAAAYQGMPAADFLLVTHMHGDHFSADTLAKLAEGDTVIVAPQSVKDALPEALQAKTHVLANGESTTIAQVMIEAVPAYNLTEDRLQFHPEGRDNGYVLTVGGKRVYIAGDTEDVPEMRALENIDVAFIPMNLPYTMPPAQAAEGVLAFEPKVVYPYHYGGGDISAFVSAVSANGDIEVRQRNWY